MQVCDDSKCIRLLPSLTVELAKLDSSAAELAHHGSLEQADQSPLTCWRAWWPRKASNYTAAMNGSSPPGQSRQPQLFRHTGTSRHTRNRKATFQVSKPHTPRVLVTCSMCYRSDDAVSPRPFVLSCCFPHCSSADVLDTDRCFGAKKKSGISARPGADGRRTQQQQQAGRGGCPGMPERLSRGTLFVA